jgi:hypothetical protein
MIIYWKDWICWHCITDVVTLVLFFFINTFSDTKCCSYVRETVGLRVSTRSIHNFNLCTYFSSLGPSARCVSTANAICIPTDISRSPCLSVSLLFVLLLRYRTRMLPHLRAGRQLNRSPTFTAVRVTAVAPHVQWKCTYLFQWLRLASMQADVTLSSATLPNYSPCCYLAIKFASSVRRIVLYKAILKPIWSCGLQLWECAKPSTISLIQRLQSKTLRAITDAPWYVSNLILHTDLNTYVKN